MLTSRTLDVCEDRRKENQNEMALKISRHDGWLTRALNNKWSGGGWGALFESSA